MKGESNNKISPHPVELRGTPISPGIAKGNIYCQHHLLFPTEEPSTHTPFNIKSEFSRLDQATSKTSIDLLELAARVEKEIDSHLSEVFGAHNQRYKRVTH